MKAKSIVVNATPEQVAELIQRVSREHYKETGIVAVPGPGGLGFALVQADPKKETYDEVIARITKEYQ